MSAPPEGTRVAAGLLLCAIAALLLAACGSLLTGGGAPQPSPATTRARLLQLLPPKLTDREGWAEDIQSSFEALRLEPSDENLCAVIAVAEQESSLRADPEVPNLPRIAMKEIEDRAAKLHVPAFLVRAALELGSPTGETYRARIDKARTERQLSEIYEDFIGEVPLGRRLLAGYNPVRTGGPMQVSIAFAEEFSKSHRRPWSSSLPVRREVFTRRGGLYFGTAHLLAYEADYDAMRYRFADFNAGQYASRNAAFQNALSLASGQKLALDGDLLVEGADADSPSRTERAARSIAAKLRLDADQIHRDLLRGSEADFARTPTYQRVFELAGRDGARTLPRAMLPQIVLQGPKISRRLTTSWFAQRVEERQQRCVARGK